MEYTVRRSPSLRLYMPDPALIIYIKRLIVSPRYDTDGHAAR